MGEKGILLHDTYGRNPRLYPQDLMAAAAAVPKSMPRIPWSHEQNWAKAIRGEAEASSPLEYASQLTETMLLGIAALRAGQGKKLLYDGERGAFTTRADANQYLTRDYRAGWDDLNIKYAIACCAFFIAARRRASRMRPGLGVRCCRAKISRAGAAGSPMASRKAGISRAGR